MRRAIIAATACAAALGASAPGASAQIVDASNVVCTGTAQWNVNLSAAYADMTVTSSTCKRTDATVENNGNPHLNVTDGGYTGGYRLSLLGVNVTGTNSFVGVAHGFIGGGPVEVVSPNMLNAELVGTNPNAPAASVEVHTPDGSCGVNCYKTKITWQTTWVDSP